MKLKQTVTETLAQAAQAARVPLFQAANDPYVSSDGKQVVLLLLGAESEVVRAAQSESIRRRAREVRYESKDEVKQSRESRVDVAIAALVGWEGVEDDDGNPLELTPKHAAILFELDHVLIQAEAAIQGHARFFKPASKG